jgi:uncharacterized membrane protein YdcZ (DUF606 family)
MRKIPKKNPKKIRFRIRTTSLHTGGRNSLGRTFLFRRMVSIAESAIVKLAILALMAKMIMGIVIFIKREPQTTNTMSNK